MSQALRVVTIFLSHTGEMSGYADRTRALVISENPRWEREHQITVRIITFKDMPSQYNNSGAQEAINQFIKDKYDFYVGLMGTKFGTKTKKFGSGTEEEYKTAKKVFVAGGSRIKQILFGFCEIPMNPFTVEVKGFTSVKSFRSEIQEKQLYFSWHSDHEFESVIRDQITKIIFDYIKDARNAVIGGARYS